MTSMTAMSQPQFRTTELQRLAKVLLLDTQTLKDGINHPTAQELKLTVHVSHRTVDHIGLQLFSDELRQAGSSPIFDFLERYFLQLKFPPTVKTASNMIRDDGFQFVRGSMSSVSLIRTTDDFAFSNNNLHYTATWRREGRTLLSVTFPVEYELISGENKIEAEDNLPSDIRSAKTRQTQDDATRSDCYINEFFSNRLYYQGGLLLSSDLHPVETVANMMLSTQTRGQYELSISQISYGFQKKVFQVPLRQWISFCQSCGCQLYFGVEDVSVDGSISGVVIAVNEAENYNHVLSVSIPSAVIANRKGTIEARLYPYVPTHNVKDMFANYHKSTSKNMVSR